MWDRPFSADPLLPILCDVQAYVANERSTKRPAMQERHQANDQLSDIKNQ
jgi:hypothetical protein